MNYKEKYELIEKTINQNFPSNDFSVHDFMGKCDIHQDEVEAILESMVAKRKLCALPDSIIGKEYRKA